MAKATPKTQKTLKAELRTERGKNAVRRVRKAGLIPGIVFGRSGETTPVSFSTKELEKILHSHSGLNTLFKMEVEGAKGRDADGPMVIVKEYQLDPVKHEFLHVSFYRIHMDRLIQVTVPVHLHGNPFGVRQEGGVLDVIHRNVEVECLPGDIPDSFDLDITNLHMNEAVRFEDLEIPEGVRLLGESDTTILTVAPPRQVAVLEEEEEEEAAEGEEVEGEEEEAEGEEEEEE